MSYRITITYLVIANEQALHSSQAAPALVWKRELTVTSDTSQSDPDWCYDRIIKAHPHLEGFTIAIWGVDVAPAE